ncbi:hypothetical protein TNCV_2179301 [Trichonephila clavipes]|uniref:Uncharacterized protein n=1 Tax=Trichonephila clavipes TaxID=2585209 RepID=A0A8X7B911_TRICX|nr:hypothetical protein TNCV_2179301 [Trichonephila clavipes]
MQEIASRVKKEKKAEKSYIMKKLKDSRAIEMQLQSTQEFIYPKYLVERVAINLTQLLSIDKSTEDGIEEVVKIHPRWVIQKAIYDILSVQHLFLLIWLSPQRPKMYPRNQRVSQQRPGAPTFHPTIKGPKKENSIIFQQH